MSEVKVPADVLELSKKAKAAMKVDGGVINLEDEFYAGTLPEGITMDTVKELQKHDTNFVSAIGHAFGQASIEAMKKDKQLEETQITTNLGKDVVGGVFRRSYEKSLGIPKDGEERKTETAYGQLNMSYKKHGSAGSRGSLKKVRDSLNAEARAALAK